MKTHARVVVIGGGMMGASLLYHLALEGCTDTVLVEKDELTSGSTWHAAGQCPSITGSYNLAKIHAYSNQLYPRLEALTGQYTSWHPSGGLRLANNRARTRMAQVRLWLLQEHRLQHGDRRPRRDPAPESVSDHGERARRRLDTGRRARRPVGHLQCARQGGPRSGRDRGAPQPRHRHAAAPERRMGSRSPRKAPSSPRWW